MKKLVFLNAAVLTAHGNFSFQPVTVDRVKEKLQELGGEFLSAIGHQSTAEIISEVFGIQCPVNRIQYEQQPGDVAIVFRLKKRAPEGAILTREQVEEIGYSIESIIMH